MKTLGIILASLAATLLGGAFAFAQEEGKGRPDRAEMRERMIERFDEDGDGKLSEEERATAREEMRERFGRGGRGPRAEGRRGEGRGPRGDRGPAEGRRRGPERDFDGDRGPDRGRGVREQRGPRAGGPGGPPRMDPDRMFDRIDQDGDGQISRQEFVKHAKAMQQRMASRRGPGGPPERGDRPGRRGPRAERDGDFDGERFRPNFNRDSDGPRGDRRPPRARQGRPEGERDFRRGRPPRGDADDDSPRPERRRRGRRDARESDEAVEKGGETAENSVEAEGDTV